MAKNKPKSINEGFDKSAEIVTSLGALSADICFYGLNPEQLRFVANWCNQAADYIEDQKKKVKAPKVR